MKRIWNSHSFFSVIFLLVVSTAMASCARYRAEREEKARHEMYLRAKYYNKYFIWVQDDVLDDIKEEVANIKQELYSFDSDFTYTDNSLGNALDYYRFADYLNDDMDSMNSEIEDARDRLQYIGSYISEVQKAIERIYDNLQSITGEGMSGEEIVRLLPYMEP